MRDTAAIDMSMTRNSSIAGKRESSRSYSSGEWLVIGYGSEIRGDDGVGRSIADVVESWRIPGVAVQSVHQLTPELAENVSRSRRVVFVDAYPAGLGDRCKVVRVHRSPGFRPGTHISNPADLLLLAKRLYDRSPRSLLIAVPSSQFEFGSTLSVTAECGANEALSLIRRLICAPVGQLKDDSCTK